MVVVLGIALQTNSFFWSILKLNIINLGVNDFTLP